VLLLPEGDFRIVVQDEKGGKVLEVPLER